MGVAGREKRYRKVVERGCPLSTASFDHLFEGFSVVVSVHRRGRDRNRIKQLR